MYSFEYQKAASLADASAALLRDGFVRHDEIRALMRAGAVGEITGWAFDAQGSLIEGLTNDRVLSVPLDQPAQKKVIGVAMATARLRAVKGAMRGKLINKFVPIPTLLLISIVPPCPSTIFLQIESPRPVPITFASFSRTR